MLISQIQDFGFLVLFQLRLARNTCEYRAHWVSIRGKFVLSKKNLGVGTRENFPRGVPREMGTEDACRLPPAALRHSRVRQSSGTEPYGDCRRVLWVPGPWGLYSGKIRFIEKPGVQD